MQRWSHPWHSLRTLVAAPRCLLCAGRSDDLLCCGCREDLPWNRLACPCCARPLSGGPLRPCPPCLRKPPPFDATIAAFIYASPVDGAIQRLKYQADFLAARWLAESLCLAVQQQAAQAQRPGPELIIPVPLHPLRLARRGYNQSQELARVLARRLDVPLGTTLARRIRATEDQIGRKAAERRRNVRGAFDVSADVSGKAIALVDDVMTTGSTLAELAKTCRKAGARQIQVWTVARVP